MSTTNQHGQFWDSITATAAPITEAGQLITALLPAETIRGRHILDAGCGAGDYTEAFRVLGAGRVESIDVSIGSLKVARSKGEAGRFVQASLSELPYPAASFDVLWAWGVLHYIPEPARALREVVRVLRPGGVAVLHTLRRGMWSALELAAAQVFSHAPRPVETVVLWTGERVIPLVARALTGKRPEQYTSKTVRQKLQERLFVPGKLATFTAAELARLAGAEADIREVRPPVSDLLRRDMSITVLVTRRA